MANENQTEFVLSAKDEVTPVVTGLITSLGRLNTALPVADKSLVQFEKSLANAATKAGLLGTSVAGAAPQLTKAQQALAQYSKQVADFEARGMRTNAAGRSIDASGRFISKAEIQGYEQALSKVKLLTESEQKMAATRAALNNRGLARNIQEQAGAYSSLGNATTVAATKASRLGAVLQNVPPNSTRYALYDVSSSLLVLGAALSAGAIASVGFAASYERAFADVQRTVNDLDSQGLHNLNQELMNLASTMPVTFQDLAHIASLGGQLGIAGSGIDEFVEAVGKISTVSDLTVDKAATAFGRFKAILGVPEEQFSNLASSILKVGVNSVATESQIVNITTQIASMAGFAGFTAEQVVGLSGALASIGAPPELSRGVVTRLFARMSQAVADGGLKLGRFAELSGTSAEKFEKAWGTSKFSNLFVNFMRNIGKEGANAVTALNELGITSVRDVPLLMRLAGATSSTGQAFGLLRQTMDDAKKGWEDNTELTEQYAVIAGTFTEQLKVLGNNFSNLAATIGGPLLSALKPLLNGLIQMVKWFTEIVNNPVGATIAAVVIGVAALSGALLLLGSGAARAVAGIIAMQTSTNGLVGSFTATKAAIVSMNASVAATPGFFRKGGAAAKGFGVALGAALGPIGLVIAGITTLISLAPQIADGFDALNGISYEPDAAFSRLVADGKTSIKNLKDMGAELISINRSMPAKDIWRDLQAADEGIAQLVESGNVEKAAQQYQTLKNKALEGGVDMKEFNAAMVDSSKAFREAVPGAKSLAQAIAEIGDESDPMIAKLEEFQKIMIKGALAFIDTGDMIKENQDAQKAAAEARVEAEKNSAGEATSAWQDYYDGQTVNLDNYLAQLQAQVDAQSAWKANLDTLAQKGVSDEILADLAKLGPEGAPLVQALVDGTSAQLDQYKSLWEQAGADSAERWAIGMATTQIKLENAFKALGQKSQDEFLLALNEGMPLEQALRKWDLDAMGNPIDLHAEAAQAYETARRYLTWASQQSTSVHISAQVSAYGNPAVLAALGMQGYSTTGPANVRVNVGQYASGGYTGPGGKYQTAGVVHKGEFVFPQESVNRIGVGNLYSMMRGTGGATRAGNGGSFASGGYARGGSMPSSMMVELSPQDRALLMTLRDIQVSFGRDAVARSVNIATVNASTRGTR